MMKQLIVTPVSLPTKGVLPYVPTIRAVGAYGNTPFLRSKAHAGFSLIDVLVGLVIAMLGIIIIFQVFSVSESIKRTTTSGGDAQINGAMAMYQLERSLKGAGYGIFASNNAAPVPSDPAGTAPVAITPGATTDSLVLTYRQNWDFGSFPPAASGVFAVPPALTNETISVTTGCNGNGSTLLQLCSSVNGVLADGVVLMKAEYGIDANNVPPQVVTTWTQTAPANVLSVAAVRIVVVARSAQPEVTRDANGNITTCATTTAGSIGYPTWIGSTVGTLQATALALDLSAQPDLAAGGLNEWKCYRYKTFENTVPLRNVIWRP